MLISLQHLKPSDLHLISGLDVSQAAGNASAKDDCLKNTELKSVN